MLSVHMQKSHRIGMLDSIISILIVVTVFSTAVVYGGLEKIGGNMRNAGLNNRVQPPEGYVVCDKCNGRKTVECISCRNTDQNRNCIRCGGDRVVKCGKCNGTGLLKSRQRNASTNLQRASGSSMKSRVNQKKLLREKLQAQKDYLRLFVRENDIVCTSRVQLAKMNLALIQKCKEEDRVMKGKLEASTFVVEFQMEFFRMLGGRSDTEDNDSSATVVTVSEQQLDAILGSLKMQHETKKKAIEKIITRPEYYKKFCDVHKWDDECCPRFGADYFTEDMKTKYASNKMKAYEMAKNGVIKCTCSEHLPIYESARERYELALEKQKQALSQLTGRYQKLKDEVMEYYRVRGESVRKLRAMEKADEVFGTIVELAREIRAM